MKRGIKLILATCLITAGSMLLKIAPGCAVDGRDFAGFYDLTNVVDQGTVVSLKFLTQVINYSDGDVIGAYVTLDDSLMLENYTAFQNVRINYRDRVFLSGDIIVPIWQYQQWLQGERPNLAVSYQDNSGNALIRPVELIQMPLGGQS